MFGAWSGEPKAAEPTTIDEVAIAEIQQLEAMYALDSGPTDVEIDIAALEHIWSLEA
jgi:hypothetical protein